MKSLVTRFPIIKLIFPMLVFVLGVGLLIRPSQLTPESPLARQAQADALGLEGFAREQYLNEMGEDPEAENQALLNMGDYWAHRVSYPTGVFNPQWLLEAKKQDDLISRGLPLGGVPAFSKDDSSPLTLDPTQFTFLGPQPLDMNGCQGCFNFGISAGRTNVVVSDPISPNIAYLGSDGGGVWKTTDCCDENTTWTVVTDDPLINSIAIGDLILDPNDHNTIYGGTGDLRYGSFSFGSAGLLKSTDAGATWAVLGADVFSPVYSQTAGVYPQYQSIGKVQVDPRNSDNVIVGTKQGIYISYDGGNNWDGPCFTNSFDTQRQDTTGLLVSDNGASTDLYAAIGTRGFPTQVQPDLGLTGANGVYKTTVPASGCPASWTLLNNGWPTGTGDGDPANDLVGRIDLAMAPSDNQVIYAQVANNTNSSGTLGVWRTTDGGTTWTQRAVPGDFIGCGSGVGQTWYNAGLAVDPNNSDIVFLSMIDVYRSTNGADTFNNMTTGYCGGVPGTSDDVHVDNHGRAFIGGSSDSLIVSSDGGIYVTHNATATQPQFTQMNNSLGTIEFYSGDITDNFAYSTNPGINAGAQDNGSMVSVWDNVNPGPATWFMRTGGDGMYARIEPAQGLRWYQESQNAGLKVSQTGPFGTFFNAAGPWGGDRLSFVFPYEIYKYCPAPGPCTHMIAGTYRVWETIQGAIPSSSWYPNSPDLTKNTLADRSFINQLAYSFTDDSIAIVGTNDGNVQYGFGLGAGTANTASWVNVTDNNTVLPNRPIQDVVTHPITPTIGWAAIGGFSQNTPATPGHVYQVTCNSDCSSFTWEDKSGNLPNIPVNSITVNPNRPNQVFAGTDWGLYYTDDIRPGSPTWQKFTAGVPSVMIWDMAVDRSNSTLALFTRSRGAYAWPLPGYAITPTIAVEPSNITSTQTPDTQVTHTLTISNVGTGDLTWNLLENANPSFGGSWSDNFDSYATGSQMHGQGGWKGWDNSPAAGALTSNAEALSAPNSVDILGASDLVHEYSGYTSGQWIYTAWQFVPDTFAGTSYFIMLNTYADGGSNNWSVQVQFDSASNLVLSDNDGATLPLIKGQWVEIRLEIDLDADVQTFYYDGQMLYQKSWVDGVSGGGVANIAAVDLFANNASTVYYDDISLMPPQMNCPPASDIPWVSVSPVSGTVSAGLADSVAVLMDSTGLATGVYTGTLCIESNDMANPVVSVPLELNVVNQVPVAVDDAYATTQGVALTVSAPGVLDNDTDGDGDALTAVLDTNPTNGTLSLNADGSFTYTPTLGFEGDATFTYHAEDGIDSSNVATVTISVANTAPVAEADAYTTTQGITLTVTAPGVLSNDSDVDGDGLMAVLDTDVTHGTLTLNTDGSFTYMPHAGHVGTDTFTYHANDGTDNSDVVTVTITVQAAEPTGYIIYLPFVTKE
ncbi:MAG: tandem-95 repeat protein [Ardenticatenaceae bacterium]|nr:tandem-95 repeat protein [Ardenticatenaceae bacterium]